MLNILHAFKRFIKLLRSINPKITLPEALEDILLNKMDEIHPAHHQILVHQGDIPEYAYYIICGSVYVYYFDDIGNRHVIRFYREDRMVCFLSFLERTESPYCIAAGRGTILSRVHYKTMDYIYNAMPVIYQLFLLMVSRYDAQKEKLREDMIGLVTKAKVKLFYKTYPCLLPADWARMDEEIAAYLQMGIRSLIRYRGECD